MAPGKCVRIVATKYLIFQCGHNIDRGCEHNTPGLNYVATTSWRLPLWPQRARGKLCGHNPPGQLWPQNFLEEKNQW